MQNKTTLHLLKLSKFPILQQLQIEEALLRADDRNWCLINGGSPPAIVMGISAKPEQHLNMKLLEKTPIPVIRRFSGGGTVFVDENTFFVTFICNKESVQVPCFPSHVHFFVKDIYTQIFQDMDFQLTENDYIFGSRKFGGNAQYMRKNRWLHHSTLLWDYNLSNMEYLLFPPKTPKYRNKRSHSEFLCRLCDYLPEKEILENKLIETLRNNFEILETELEEITNILSIPHRKSTEIISERRSQFLTL